MSNALDMSLDDIIKSNKRSRSGAATAAGSTRGGRGRGGGRGASGLGPNRGRIQKKGGANRTAPYPTAAKAVGWQHMFADQTMAAQAGRASSLETGTKLYISNLDYGVSNDDIKELFSEVGDIKKYSIHYDRSGRSKGTAEVVYSRKADAVSAVKRYNNVQLDGKPMKIEMVGANVTAPAPVITNVPRGNANGAPRGGFGRGGPFGRIRGGGIGVRGRGGRGAGGRGRGRGRGRSEKLSAEALDAELEKYHQESMQIN